MKNIISCRPESYGRYTSQAYELLQKLGVHWVEIAAPPVGEVNAVVEKLQPFGLQVASVACYARLQQPDFLEKIEAAAESAAQLGASVMFTSQHAEETDRKIVYQRLREACDVAGGKGVTLALETHPDLCMNAQLALETMEGVNHPNIRVNFDPANIHYYNQGINAASELQQIAPYVRAVHLKDSNGGFHEHNFPAIGDGVVDWKAIFTILNERGMYGPFTLEMEGIAGETLDFEQTEGRIRRSLEHLAEIGV